MRRLTSSRPSMRQVQWQMSRRLIRPMKCNSSIQERLPVVEFTAAYQALHRVYLWWYHLKAPTRVTCEKAARRQTRGKPGRLFGLDLLCGSCSPGPVRRQHQNLRRSYLKRSCGMRHVQKWDRTLERIVVCVEALSSLSEPLANA